ncbi:MAG: hypothetical protein GY722_19035 [bacterium]|nr:hypothetical protein [bacterium]
MIQELHQLIEKFTAGTPEELENATIYFATLLEFYSIGPKSRTSRRRDMAVIVPEYLLDLEVTESDLRKLVQIVTEDGPSRLDLGVCFWILGKPSQALGAAAAVRLLERKRHLLGEDQAAQAATTLRNMLILPDPELEHQLRSEWFSSVLREWLASESQELKRSARSLEKHLSARWGISV